MIWIVSVVFFLIVQCVAADAADSTQGTKITWQYSYTIGIVVGSALVTIIFTGLTYLMVTCMKRTVSPIPHSIDHVFVEKDTNGYFDENMNNDVAPDVSNINQIHPILSASQVISSIQLSFEDLSHVISTHRWFPTQRSAVEENPVHETNALPV